MSTFGHESTDWFDDELRRVPLPEGLLARLRAIAVADDAGLDAAVREVPLPAGLLSRLEAIAAYEDEHIDADLRDVPLPSGLVASLRTIPEYTDQHVDAELRNVPVPAGLLTVLGRIASEDVEPVEIAARGRSRRRTSIWQLAAAASLLFVISFSYLFALGGFVASAYRDSVEPDWTVVIRESPVDLQLGMEEPMALVQLRIEPDRTVEPIDKPFPTEIAWEEASAPASALTESEFDRWFASDEGRSMMLASMFDLQTPPFVASSIDPSKPLDSVADIQPRGLTPTWGAADLLLFLMANKAQPFVPLTSYPSLNRSDVPLVGSTESFEWSWDELFRPDANAADIKDALAERVRVEEFLQAIDYDVRPADAEPVALRAFGGPSPFGTGDARMLQFVVRAADAAANQRQPTHVTVVIDTSESMHKHDGLKDTQRALRDLVARLENGDRMSLIAFGDTAQVLAENTARRDVLLAEIDALQVQPGNNVGEGVRLAASGIHRLADANRKQSLVIVSDGVGLMAERTVVQIERLFGNLAKDNVRVALVDLTREGLKDVLLPRLAAAGRGELREVSSADEIALALQAALAGGSQTLVNDARLSVTFNPDAVASYRLLGHEPTSAVGVVEAPVTVGLNAGQTVTGLFEVHLKPGGAYHVGWAELTWRDARTGERHTQRQPISRIQFAPTFAEAPMPLQAAIIAAETAELLRKSPFAERPESSLAMVRQLADQVDLQMAENQSFRRFVSFLDRALSIGLD